MIKKECDICDLNHHGDVKTRSILAIFDHDQEDGLSKCKPYFSNVNIEMCDGCWDYMMKERRYVYAYGAMGFNKYYLVLDKTQ